MKKPLAANTRSILWIALALLMVLPFAWAAEETPSVSGGKIDLDRAQAFVTERAAAAKGLAADGTDPALAHSQAMFERGRQIFRFDRLGSHTFFSRELKLHRALRTVGPAAALGLGVKVDSEALPAGVLEAIQTGAIDLDDPANTVALILLDAVVGVRGKVAVSTGELFEVGITCAFCHSTVDDSVAPGIGRRLDGWANRDLNVGAIIGISPRLQPIADLLGVDVATVQAVLAIWGPGKFDAHLNLDAKAFRPDGGSGAVLIPPAFGLAGVNLATYTGWGSVAYWNAFVGTTEMGGRGTFFDPRMADAGNFPIAAGAGFDNQRDEVDVITDRLATLHYYQLSLPAPPAPEGSFDAAAAARGELVFAERAQCATCHVPPLYTEPGWNLHTPDEIGIDDFQSSRSPTGRYRTTPLRGLWTHGTGGYYHDGRFATLLEVIEHYDGHLELGLTAAEKSDLVEFLKSL